MLDRIRGSVIRDARLLGWHGCRQASGGRRGPVMRLAPAREIARSVTQLPVSSYFDPELFEHEQRVLFARGPGYAGHELMVPEVGDYYTLFWREHAQVLVRNPKGVELLSNVCRHRQALMLKGK